MQPRATKTSKGYSVAGHGGASSGGNRHTPTIGRERSANPQGNSREAERLSRWQWRGDIWCKGGRYPVWKNPTTSTCNELWEQTRDTVGSLTHTCMVHVLWKDWSTTAYSPTQMIGSSVGIGQGGWLMMRDGPGGHFNTHVDLQLHTWKCPFPTWILGLLLWGGSLLYQQPLFIHVQAEIWE